MAIPDIISSGFTIDTHGCELSHLLETDERVQIWIDEAQMNKIVTYWLARDTPALRLPLQRDLAGLTEVLVNHRQ